MSIRALITIIFAVAAAAAQLPALRAAYLDAAAARKFRADLEKLKSGTNAIPHALSWNEYGGNALDDLVVTDAIKDHLARSESAIRTVALWSPLSILCGLVAAVCAIA